MLYPSQIRKLVAKNKLSLHEEQQLVSTINTASPTEHIMDITTISTMVSKDSTMTSSPVLQFILRTLQQRHQTLVEQYTKSFELKFQKKDLSMHMDAAQLRSLRAITWNG